MSVRALHITPSIGSMSFGLGQVTVNLAKAQNDLNVDAWIWCLDPTEQINWAIAQSGLTCDKVRGFHHNYFLRFRYSYAMHSAAKMEGGRFDVVHQHGIWTLCSYTTRRLQEIHGIPSVIAPHGSLQRWALNRSSWKKHVALIAYEKKNLHQASCLHATAEAEIADFRDYGLLNPIALIPNGISDKWLTSKGDNIRFRKIHSIHQDRRILLFMSRITPKKGLPNLLQAIFSLRERFANWILVIAGNDEFGHLKDIKSLVDKLNLLDSVIFTGSLYGQTKRDAFAASDAFILPSYSEGAPMVVLDSLAAGVPVITTKATPWEALVNYKCGWWVEPSVDGLVDALQSVSASSSPQLKEMGIRGKELVRAQYLWSSQAQKTLDLYAWILGKGAKPDFIVCD